MKSIHNAYQAYEGRAIQGELDSTPRKAVNRFVPREPLLVQVGDLLIYTCLALKRSRVTRKSMAWSPTTGVKP